MDNEKILYGLATMHQIEMDDEDSEADQINAELSYDVNTVIDSIGTEDFKNTFLNFINSIKIMPIDKQQSLASSILSKINDVYIYEFSPEPDIYTIEQINRVYDLVTFIEYNNLDFCAKVWENLNVDFKNTNIDLFCTTNQKRLMNSIEKVISTLKFGTYSDGQLTVLFLRTYYKDGMIKLFIRMSKADKQLILLKLLEKGEHNESNGYGKEST